MMRLFIFTHLVAPGAVLSVIAHDTLVSQGAIGLALSAGRIAVGVLGLGLAAAALMVAFGMILLILAPPTPTHSKLAMAKYPA